MDETYSQRGNFRGGRARSSGAPRGGTLETVPGGTSGREGFWGPSSAAHTRVNHVRGLLEVTAPAGPGRVRSRP
ncbi:hypothetical protein GCM10009548_38890 [Streptomyces malaysiensis subsp. malaysiensis]